MSKLIETFTPAGSPKPLGPYSHVTKYGSFITIGGTASVDSETAAVVGSDTYAQARNILGALKGMLESVGSDLNHVLHMNVFMKQIEDYGEMNRTYVEAMGAHRPARTVIGVAGLPKPEILLTMNLTAVTKE